MGGLGKTTFAQLIFEDAEVQAHFDKKAWVCVSDPFDVIKIAKEILELVEEEKTQDCSIVSLQKLLKSIQAHIKDKKFLLVLDDVWTEDPIKWDNLKLPILMQTCAEGSRILVTTRKQEVAQMMRATSDMIMLDKLSHSDSLELFNSVAFRGREQDKSNKGFGDTAEKIVRKCGGLPLVVKTLGGLLLHKGTIREWEEVLNSEIWKVKVVQEDVFRPLLLSYYDLALEIKSCLLYCSTFPKDFEFSIEMLIEQWMSQDYLNVRENSEETTEGREVFNKLVMRCFFQDFQKHALTKEIIGCKMHDTVHDFVQYLTQNECFTMEATCTHGIETSSANDTTKPRPGDKVRHLTFKNASSISSIVNCEILRTLANFDSGITSIDSNLIRRLKRLRTLNLSRNLIWKVPEEIGDLMHLSLQTLRLDGCEQLAKLPDNMGKLINLKHLQLRGCAALRYLPKGIGSIRNLRTLDGDGRVYCSEDAEALTLGDLSMMNQLRRLSITIERIGEDAATMDDVLDALQPHENLESFILYGYKGSTWPTWMTTSYLTRLTAFYLESSYSSVLPPLGKLPSLKVLKLWRIAHLEEIGGEFFGIEETSSSSFPSLETLALSQLYSFEKWELGRGEAQDSSNSQMKSISIMPRLSSLYIVKCRKLKQLPDFLLQNAPLQNLLNLSSCILWQPS
ncbi:hypothetical protein M0R45_027060 [Rubus argutus]|uniref:Uncharacterized protein n=1 Tax=Rubus argutus TaxID=59490 RepID=A0AAW1X1V8_RUBAR